MLDTGTKEAIRKDELIRRAVEGQVSGILDLKNEIGTEFLLNFNAGQNVQLKQFLDREIKIKVKKIAGQKTTSTIHYVN